MSSPHKHTLDHTGPSLFSSFCLGVPLQLWATHLLVCFHIDGFSSGKRCHTDCAEKHALYFFTHQGELLQIAEIQGFQGPACEEKRRHQEWVKQSGRLNLTAVRRAGLDSTVTLYTEVSGTGDASMSQFSSLNWQKTNRTKKHCGNNELIRLLWLHPLSAWETIATMCQNQLFWAEGALDTYSLEKLILCTLNWLCWACVRLAHQKDMEPSVIPCSFSQLSLVYFNIFFLWFRTTSLYLCMPSTRGSHLWWEGAAHHDKQQQQKPCPPLKNPVSM